MKKYQKLTADQMAAQGIRLLCETTQPAQHDIRDSFREIHITYDDAEFGIGWVSATPSRQE